MLRIKQGHDRIATDRMVQSSFNSMDIVAPFRPMLRSFELW